jgi:hypothetical protein
MFTCTVFGFWLLISSHIRVLWLWATHVELEIPTDTKQQRRDKILYIVFENICGWITTLHTCMCWFHWLIIYGFMSRTRFFHLYGDVTVAGEGLQNVGLWSALRAFEQGGIFIVPHLLWHGTSVFPVSSDGPLHSVAFYDTHEDVEDIF